MFLPSCYPLFLCCFTSLLPVGHPLTLFLWTNLFPVMLLVFSLSLSFHLFSSSNIFILLFPGVLLLSFFLLRHFPHNSPLLQSLSFLSIIFYSDTHLAFFPFPIPLLVVLGNVHQAYWHRLVVDEFHHDYTRVHTHTHTKTCVHVCTPKPVGDGGWWAMQALSVHAQLSCSRNLIRPPGHRMALASILTSLPFFSLGRIWSPGAIHCST